MVSVFALAVFSAAGFWVTNQRVNADTVADAQASPSASPAHTVNCAELEKTKDISQTDNDIYNLRCSGKYSAEELAAMDSQTPTPEEKQVDGPKNCEELQQLIDPGNADPVNSCAIQTTIANNNVDANDTVSDTSLTAVAQARSKAPLHWAILITDAIIVLGLLIALTVRILNKILNPTTAAQTVATTGTPSNTPNGQPKTIDDLQLDLQ